MTAAAGSGPALDPSTPFVSTGSLPAARRIQELIEDAHRRYVGVVDGALSQVYPALAAASPDRFGIAVAGTDGQAHTAGDASAGFPVMSVAKPFVLALACHALGVEEVRRRVGVNATGRAFNSLAAVEDSPDGRTNPMVNPGAIATTALLPGTTLEDRWARLREGLSAFAGRELILDEDTHRSAAASNHRNRALAHFLHSRGAMTADPDETVELYTRQSCLAVTAVDLALMGATLADGGVHPVTRRQVVDLPVCRAVLTVMTIAGLYETSGDWMLDIGLPGKSGIGGGIVTVSPGKGGLGTFSPLLDGAGNSVRGQLTAAFLSRALGLDLLASAPAR